MRQDPDNAALLRFCIDFILYQSEGQALDGRVTSPLRENDRFSILPTWANDTF